MDFKETMNFIDSFSHSGSKIVDLSRIKGLLEALGNPHKYLEFVHIAGTNGKGSVLEYCSRTLIKSGYKTGQFTSPYIQTYCDRIRINGKNIPENTVARIAENVKNHVDNNCYSQFEISFAIALLYFLEEKCDIVFLETGIGGSLDATNIIEKPILSIVTSVSLDHTAILGDTVEEIALHKLGIIKENCPVVLSFNNRESVKKLAEKTAFDKNSTLFVPKKENLHIISNNIFGSEFEYKNQKYTLKMCGEHQIVNAVTAIEAVGIIKNHFVISDMALKEALSESFVNSRIEIVSKSPLFIIDGGHNQAGVDSLIEILRKSGINKVCAVFGMVYGKAVDYAVSGLSGLFKKVYCVDGYIENNIPAQVLAEMFENKGVESEECSCSEAVSKALEYAQKENIPLVVCGSLYLASVIKNSIIKE